MNVSQDDSNDASQDFWPDMTTQHAPSQAGPAGRQPHSNPSAHRSTAVLHRTPGRPAPVLATGNGLHVTDASGRSYLDAVSGGAAVSCLGHGNARVARAIQDQLSKLAYIHGSFFSSEPAEALADILLRNAPAGMARVLFSSGGSESNEAALKLVRQTWLERDRPEKSIVISRRQSYHGATLGALAVSGNMGRRAAYAPWLFDVRFIDPCYAWRFQRPDESEEAYGRRAADQLEQAILDAGPDKVAAFIAEPVVGATLGCVPAVRGYFARIREICDTYDVLLVLDEIMCGTGRSGTFYACEADGVAPDILTLAKGLGGGFQPIGATLVSQGIVDTLQDGSGALKHGLTYMGHPVACAAALEVQNIIRQDNLLDNVRRQGTFLRDCLSTRLQHHPYVGNIRGRGLFLGVELVRNRDDKTPFDPQDAIAARLKQAALDAGLMIYPGSGTIDGERGDHVLFAPAYVITEDEVVEIVDRFCTALDALFPDAATRG